MSLWQYDFHTEYLERMRNSKVAVMDEPKVGHLYSERHSLSNLYVKFVCEMCSTNAIFRLNFGIKHVRDLDQSTPHFIWASILCLLRVISCLATSQTRVPQMFRLVFGNVISSVLRCLISSRKNLGLQDHH